MANETITNAPETAAPTVVASADPAEAVPPAAPAEAVPPAAAAKIVPPGLDPNRESLKARRSREGKVFSDGFKIPGRMSFSDLPGKVCVKCGFNALKFSQQCPKCGGDLVPE